MLAIGWVKLLLLRFRLTGNICSEIQGAWTSLGSVHASSSVKIRLHEQFLSPAIVMQVSEIIALPSRGKIATRLHDAMARFADR